MTTSSYKTITDTNPAAQTVVKILSNHNRFAIMQLLFGAKEDLCVNEISDAVGISQSATSHQLAYLEAYGVVEGVSYGRTKCYLPTDVELTEKISRVISALE
jgi:predicted transcriptional regulator